MPPFAFPARRALLAALLSSTLLAALPGSPAAFGDDWTSVDRGVDYRLFTVSGPNRVHVARLALSAPDVIVESSIASGELSQGFETVSGMASRYDGSLIGWGGTWGRRARVVVAINGSSFDAETGYPYGGLFQSGWYAEEYGDLAGGSGFVWMDNGTAAVRGCVEHLDERQVVTNLRTRAQYPLASVNPERRHKGLILFTPQYGSATPEGPRDLEAVLRVDRPLGLVALPRHATATLLEFRDGQGETPLLFDEIVIAARGSEAREFLGNLEPGDRVGISREITDLGFGCRNTTTFDWSNVYAGIGGGFVFLRNGRVQESNDAGAYRREPRTAVCLNEEYAFFVVVDGRDDGVSEGMALDELAEFCQDELEADWGLNQDGGGSSAMWVEGRIVNKPSDGQERPVANGLMMVAVEPAFRSRRFAPGFNVTIQAPSELRTGPGPMYPSLWIATPGQEAQIARTASSLQGVFVGGSYWWKAEVDGVVGFLAEQSLVRTPGALAWFQLPTPVLAVAKP